MCTLAHAFEAAGLSTVVISSIREVTERMRPPRALHAEFPLGHPLGKPRDAAFQHRVLEAAFALLDAPAGPVLVDFPETLQSEGGEPLVCSLPPRYDPNLHPAVDEAQLARRLRAASPSATPNIRLVGFADRLLGRDGRMVAAIESIGRGEAAYEGSPFVLHLTDGD